MIRVTQFLLAGLYLAALPGCRRAVEVGEAEPPPPAVNTDFSRLADLLAGMPSSARVALYEGLPGEFWEPELRAQELARADTLDIHGQPVYEEPLTLTAADAEQLAALLSTPDAYQPLSPAARKTCGGFTAEHALAWTTEGATSYVLICLECGEVQLFGPQSDLHCDLSTDAAQKLKSLLASYRQHNPAEPPGPRADSRTSR